MELDTVLSLPKTIAMVGLSDNPERPSYEVARYLIDRGFTVIPVNPMIQETMGLRSYPSISAIPPQIHLDIVDIFRKPDQVIAVLTEVVASGRKPFIWLQEGVGSEVARHFAEENGLQIVMDVCMMKMHRNMPPQSPH